MFLYERSEIQVQAQNPVTSLPQISNAARARHKGFEVEVSAKPADRLSLRAGAAYLVAKYREFPDALIYIPRPVPAGAIPGSLGNEAVAEDVSGQRVEHSPEWTFNLSGSYRIEMPGGSSLTPSANIFHSASYYFNRGNRLRQPAYTLINAELTWGLPLQNLSVSAWVRNLTDNNYAVGYVTTGFGDRAAYAEPRTYGLRTRFAF